MSDPGELSLSEVRNKRGQNLPSPSPQGSAFSTQDYPPGWTPPPPPRPPESGDAEDEEGFKLPVDRWRIAAAIKRRWQWVLAAACAGAVLGFAGGHVKVPYKIKVTFILREVSPAFSAGLVGESYRPQQLTMQTLANLIKSPELIHRVAIKTQPPLSEAALKKSVEAAPEQQTDLISLTLAGKTPQSLLALATNYAYEAVQIGKELQVGETRRMIKFYEERIQATDKALKEANDQLIQFQKESQMVDPDAEAQTYMKQLADIMSKSDMTRIDSELADLQIAALQSELARQNPVAQKLEAARSRLTDLLSRYTEAHPAVQGLRQEITALEKQLASTGTNVQPTGTSSESSLTSALYLQLVQLQTRKATAQKELEALGQLKQSLQEKVTAISTNGLLYALLKAKRESLKNSLDTLGRRQNEQQIYEDSAQGYYRLFAPLRLEDIDTRTRLKGVLRFSFIGFVLGALAVGAAIAGVEILDDRLKTAVDVRRVTGLPLLATLGDLNTMSAAEKDTWAFRAWTALSGQLSVSANHGMVCGFISSTRGEGRSTWINLLVNAASQRGLRVLSVATRPSASGSESAETGATASEQVPSEPADLASAKAEAKTESHPQIKTLTPQVFVSPLEVTRQLTGPSAPPIAHIPLPGWVWNLERRKQWQNALAHWRALDNLVLLVELPPASVPEAVLLAESLPQIIWLVDSGKPHARATREQLETLRHAKCRLVGAVLNHEPKPVFQL